MDQIDSLLNRPRAYENIDGVGELNLGFMCLGFALLIWLQVNTAEHSIWNRMYMLFVWVGLMVLISYIGTREIKKHITYPRTGFVKYRTHDSKWPLIAVLTVAFVAAAAVSAGVFLAVRAHWIATSAFPAVVGCLVSASYAFGITRTVRSNAVGWKWAVPASILLGSMAIAALPADLTAMLAPNSWAITGLLPGNIGAFLLCLMFLGAIFLLSGGITFWLYLRHTQAPAKEAYEPGNPDVQ
jgi:predicted small integral membrane protein